jgi:uncharacterized protein (DUF885 family)
MLTRRDALAWAGVVALSAVSARAGAAAMDRQKLDALFRETVDSDPTLATQWGFRRPDGSAWNRWTIKDEDWCKAALRRSEAHLAVAGKADAGSLNTAVFAHVAQDARERLTWRDNDYAYHASTAPHFRAFSALIAFQPVASAADADAFVERARHCTALCAAEFDILRAREGRAVRLPGFNFANLSASAREAAKKAANARNAGHPVIDDFRRKAGAAGLPAALVNEGTARIARSLEAEFAPLVVAHAEAFGARARQRLPDQGVWSLPGGDAYYASQIRSHTTLALDPADVHSYGLLEVARLKAELVALAPALGVSADFDILVRALRTDPRFLYADDPAGRQAAMKMAQDAAAAALAKRTEVLLLPLRSGLEVRAVDALSAASAGRAQYVEPGADGAPGILFLNLSDMTRNPRYQLLAVVHHEAVPGHHLQASVLDPDRLPLFRKHLYINSFAEGWALYAEKLADELSLYPDAQSQAGRVALELFRAVRLVVDTGIHALRWSFERALSYMHENCANPPEDNLMEIKRYFNWPAQALGYKIGMREMEDLRERARQRLGAAFELPGFHDALLGNGSLPLPILRQQMGVGDGARSA